MLKQRVLTAVIGLPLLLALLLFGPPLAILALFVVMVAIATYETAHMLVPRLENLLAEDKAQVENPRWLVPVAMGLSCFVFFAASWASPEAAKTVMVLTFLLAFLIGAFLAPDNNRAFGRTTALLVSIVYGSLPWVAIWELQEMGESSRYLVFLLAIVWSGDTAAYFGGRAFGKRKLAPRISPNKTVEGSIAGLSGSVLAAFLVNLCYDETIGSGLTVFISGLLGGALGQMGDLLESTLKRFSGVKDSGVIFPGHGGILDRVDGLLFAAPVIWFILYIS